jgi:hypothetical protein
MSVLDRAREHYADVLRSEPTAISIPEWGEDFFVRPSVNMRAKMEIQRAFTDQSRLADAFALTLIHYLCNKQGDPIFTKGDLMELKTQVDPDVLIRVAGEIGALQPKTEDAEGN